MQTLRIPNSHIIKVEPDVQVIDINNKNAVPGDLEKWFINLAIKIHIFFITCLCLRHPKKIWKIYFTMIKLRNNIWGGKMKKLYRIDGKYYYSIYSPGWPSLQYINVIKRELQRHTSPNLSAEKPSFIFLAITRKCPMRCEHCFEWDNLNQKESFTKDDLINTVKLYQKQEVLQIHFSGGEPMVRIKDLLSVMDYASKKSACWVVTSGFNLTAENARLLKQAGCKGVVVSIDHYIPEMHNLFRGHAQSFQNAIQAVRHAKHHGLVTAISICVTKQFLNAGHLMPYIEFAKDLGVQFVQVLEPRNIGHYEGKDVSLDEAHISQIEKIFKLINHGKSYAAYPTLMYHGYHQRRVGCFAGSRSVYIDSAGDVHSCPFCHTKSFNVIDLIRNGNNELPQKENRCPRFEKIA